MREGKVGMMGVNEGVWGWDRWRAYGRGKGTLPLLR